MTATPFPVPELEDIPGIIEPLRRLDKDLKAAAREMRQVDALFLVDYYYQVQENRKRSRNQERAANDADEPNALVSWVAASTERLEQDIKIALGEFAAQYRVGFWLQSLHGIGPVISAGMLASYDIRKARTCGGFWRLTGLDPTRIWLGKKRSEELMKRVAEKHRGPLTPEQIAEITKACGIKADKLVGLGKSEAQKLVAKLPWNASLKSFVLFRFGQTQVYHSSHKDCFYGRLYAAKKAQLVAANQAGEYAEQARAKLAEDRIGRATDAYKALTEGRLPDDQIHKRAVRWMAKLFLSHLYHAMHEDYHGKPPEKPYVFEHVPGHTHLIEPPGWRIDLPGQSIRDLLRD